MVMTSSLIIKLFMKKMSVSFTVTLKVTSHASLFFFLFSKANNRFFLNVYPYRCWRQGLTFLPGTGILTYPQFSEGTLVIQNTEHNLPPHMSEQVYTRCLTFLKTTEGSWGLTLSFIVKCIDTPRSSLKIWLSQSLLLNGLLSSPM